MLKIKWKKVLKKNDIVSKPIVRWINLGNGTMFRICAFFTHNFNDMPKDGLFVAIESVCAYLFPISDKIHWEYVSQKLLVPESDARPLADWINIQMNNKVKLYAVYDRYYIDTNETVVYAGERASEPLCPEIIEC